MTYPDYLRYFKTGPKGGFFCLTQRTLCEMKRTAAKRPQNSKRSIQSGL